MVDSEANSKLSAPRENFFKQAWIEFALMLCFLFLYVGELPPDVNEVHYLTKARYNWDTSYCPRDIFVTSPGAQPLFVNLFGWMTTAWGFTAAAWVGRLIAWILVATGWLRLARAVRLPWGFGLLSLSVAVIINECLHMAGEWFVGGIEAKSLAYGFVIWGSAYLVEGQLTRFLICLAMAIAFHPLVGGWFLLTGIFAQWMQPDFQYAKAWQPKILIGMACILVAMAISIFPLLQYDANTDSTTKAAAHQIYVFARLPHHLAPHLMRPIRIWRFAALVVVWLLATQLMPSDPRQKSLHGMGLGALGIGCLGWIIDLAHWYVPEFAASLLRLYWFRAADVAIAWSVAMGISSAIGYWLIRKEQRGTVALSLILVLNASVVSDQIIERTREARPPADRQGSFGLDLDAEQRQAAYQAWKDVCLWARTNTPTDALFMTPLKSQTFRWYADRSEFINWKDMPQNAAGIVEWSRRCRVIKELGIHDHDRILQEQDVLSFAANENIDYVIVVRQGIARLWGNSVVYRNGFFAVLKVHTAR